MLTIWEGNLLVIPVEERGVEVLLPGRVDPVVCYLDLVCKHRWQLPGSVEC
jgi:hypothetical protein